MKDCSGVCLFCLSTRKSLMSQTAPGSFFFFYACNCDVPLSPFSSFSWCFYINFCRVDIQLKPYFQHGPRISLISHTFQTDKKKHIQFLQSLRGDRNIRNLFINVFTFFFSRKIFPLPLQTPESRLPYQIKVALDFKRWFKASLYKP